MTSAGLQPYVWMLCGCGWFTVMALAAAALGRDAVQWQGAAFARSALATFFALLLARATHTKLVLRRPRVLWLRSIAGSCSMLATFYALTHMPASDVLTLTNTFPMWVALLSWPLMGERPTLGVWGAVACAVLGVAVAMQPGGAEFNLPASVSAVAASFFTAVAMLGLNRLRGVAALAVVVHFSAVSTLFAALAYLVFPLEPGPTGFDSQYHLLLLLTVGATATVGQVFLTRAFRAGPATNVSVVGLSQVVFVLVCEALVGWKQVTLSTVFGTLLVIGPTAWLMLRAHRRPAEEPEAVIE
jgi:drug/metabolite transporter (DMT)-like permease